MEGRELLRCLGATPFWPLLGWALVIIACPFLLLGVGKVTAPFTSPDLDNAAAFNSINRVDVIVAVLLILDLLMTERTLQYKIGLRYPSYFPPFYGNRMCAPRGGSYAKNICGYFCKLYPFLVLLDGWTSVLLIIIFGSGFIILATVLFFVASIVKTSSKIEATAAVEALLKALNTDPFYINVNISSIDTIIHNVSLDSDSMLVGAVMIVVGTIVMILAQKTEKSPLLQERLPKPEYQQAALPPRPGAPSLPPIPKPIAQPLQSATRRSGYDPGNERVLVNA